MSRGQAGRWIAVVFVSVVGTAGCRGNATLERLSEARRLSADLLVQFTKAADAANRAVMAETDDASAGFAREATASTQAVETGAGALKSVLDGLGYADDTRLLAEFSRQFAEYRALDRTILELAVENTNLKAQRISFGAAQQSADAFREAVEGVVARDPSKEAWHVRALAATAIASVREIQALQAPHIAEADDAAMKKMEARIVTAAAATRKALEELAPVVQPASRPKLTAATTAFDAFMGLNAEILALSHRNTNVRSLALSLNQKERLTAACSESLRKLREDLAGRGFAGTR